MIRIAGLVAVVTSLWSGCDVHDPTVVFYRAEDYRFSRTEQRTITRIAEDTLRDVRRVMPSVPTRLTLRVWPDTKVDASGDESELAPPDVIYWYVDPRHAGGVVGVADRHLRGTLAYALANLVRRNAVEERTLLDFAVMSGFATVFERDVAGARPPWADYPADVSTWATELRSLPSDAEKGAWMFRHPDGRRWIGPKVGTYLVDRAMRSSGKPFAELVTLPTQDVLRLADSWSQ